MRTAFALVVTAAACGRIGFGSDAAPSPSGLAVVQTQNQHLASAAAVTADLQPTRPRSLLVAFVREGTSSAVTWAVSDNAAQTWTQVACGYVSANTTDRAAMSYVASSPSITSVTATFSTTAAPATMVVYEIAGAAPAAVADGCVNNSANNDLTTLASGALTTSAANDILLYAVGVTTDQTAPFSAGSGYAIPPAASNVRAAIQYEVVSAIQNSASTSMTWPSPGRPMTTFAAFRAP